MKLRPVASRVQVTCNCTNKVKRTGGTIVANKCIFYFWINLSGVKGFIYIDKNNKNKINNKYLYLNGCHFCTFRTEVSSTRGFNNLFNILRVQNTCQKMLRAKQNTQLSAP